MDRFVGLIVHVIHHTADARSVRLTVEDVDDLCGEVFVALLTNDFAVLRAFEGRASLATYLAVVARRVVSREMARRRIAEALGHVSAHHAALESAAADEHEIDRIADRDMVEKMLEGLGAKEASVVRKYHLEGWNYREISEQLSIPENSVGPMLYRAREKLRAFAS